ncbi:hypothetical protein [Halorhabdus amylolytica]|uniref:hypothetical protein n=1 Tax=Halorhabdus amylolytica TaxID=2559573 RepID=UPI0010AA6AB5|nr:hypothetical protein [Halorhabdus amylolytica]
MPTEREFVKGLVRRLRSTFGERSSIETEVTTEPSGARCDILLDSPSGARYAIEATDAFEWQETAQARFYGDLLDARPVVAVPPGGVSLDRVLPLATAGNVAILPIETDGREA